MQVRFKTMKLKYNVATMLLPHFIGTVGSFKIARFLNPILQYIKAYGCLILLLPWAVVFKICLHNLAVDIEEVCGSSPPNPTIYEYMHYKAS